MPLSLSTAGQLHGFLFHGRKSDFDSNFFTAFEDTQQKAVPTGPLKFTDAYGNDHDIESASIPKCKQDCEAKVGILRGTFDVGIQGSFTSDIEDDPHMRQRIKPNDSLTKCNKMCEHSLTPDFTCFPGDATVTVRNKGRVALADVKLGDMVMAMRRKSDGSGWDLHFDEVIGFLHRNPSISTSFFRVKHELGVIELTRNHLLFVQQSSDCAAKTTGEKEATPIMASDVRKGDHVLTPWIDGTLAYPKVLSIEVIYKKGVFAPLLHGGTLFVDGTAASCYAIPECFAHSAAFNSIIDIIGGSKGAHCAAHAAFLPVRLFWSIASGQLQVKAGESEDSISTCNAAGIHPYAWALCSFAAALR